MWVYIGRFKNSWGGIDIIPALEVICLNDDNVKQLFTKPSIAEHGIEQKIAALYFVQGWSLLNSCNN
jgi:hypothetical protein